MEKRYRVRSFRLSDEQIEFLKTLDNPSEWLRRVIDEKMIEMKSGEDRGMSLVRKIQKMEREIENLENDKDYTARIERLISIKKRLEVYNKLREFLNMEKPRLDEEIHRYMAEYGISVEDMGEIGGEALWRIVVNKIIEDSKSLHDIWKDKISMKLAEERFYGKEGSLKERILLRISMKFSYDDEETLELDSKTFKEHGLDSLIEKLDSLIKSTEEEKPILEKIVSIFDERIRKLQEEKAKLEEELMKI